MPLVPPISDLTPLPKGWKRAVDSKTQKPFFYHRGSGRTTWNREFGGSVLDPQIRDNKILPWSPAQHAGDWVTPILVIHGGHDYRIHQWHGISAFQTAQWLGIESKFVRFPTMSHWVYAPQESVVWHEQVIGWLNNYLQ
ncbi:hypothetical protein KIPB_000051 [Kipferlia bialata]|uniref:WW domain-containing protein n=1 Tax=Kipferlia bialata TaxID=797122 RepID=A0A9K3GEM1_9EUKA|nr:hypothetical protein KIPB_000051 [Kipferlia bialata]|eukprot:g51.t1